MQKHIVNPFAIGEADLGGRSVSSKVPLEDEEAVAFADWLRARQFPHTHVANEIGGSSKAAKMRSIKAKKMGQMAGVWDYEIFIPIIDKDKGVTAYQEVRIELKRRKGGRTTAEQRKWGGVYTAAGIPCAVCKGAQEAIRFVLAIEQVVNGG